MLKTVLDHYRRLKVGEGPPNNEMQA